MQEAEDLTKLQSSSDDSENFWSPSPNRRRPSAAAFEDTVTCFGAIVNFTQTGPFKKNCLFCSYSC